MGLRHAIALALIAFAGAAPSAQRIDGRAAARLARNYLVTWKQSLAAVVAEERYHQTLTYFPFGRHVTTAQNTTTRRQLVSDVLLVRAGDAWLMFRDVMAVDGASVHDRQRRFDDLFVRPDAGVVTTARRIADEGARYNLGRLFRNLNTPATTLVFLEDAYESSVRWRDATRVDLDGTAALELAFDQSRPPFAVRSLEGKPQPAKGRLWIDPASGRILRTYVDISGPIAIGSAGGRPIMARSFMRITARFGPVPGLDPWVPLSMDDEYEVSARAEERMKGSAVYTNHRLFQTSVRIVGGDR